MKFLLIAASLLHLALGASIPKDIICPHSCTCEVKNENFQATCTSYEFIKKLIPKQQTKIVSLNINNALLVNIDSKLKYLKNLHRLDLSNNVIATLPSEFPYLPKLKNLNLSSNYLNSVTFSQLPKNLQTVDLSNNSIENFPKDWTSLKHLKSLYLHDNPINCDCDNLLIYEQLLKGGVGIPDNLTCFYPKEFHGRLISTVNCTIIKENLLNHMLGDEAGSGLEDFDAHDEIQASLADDQEQFINAEGVAQPAGEEDFLEGSGDEGSGLIPIFPISEEPKPCVFNCSTPSPVGLDDETDASPPPTVNEQFKIFFEDIFNPQKVEEATTTTTTPTPPQQESKEVESTIFKDTDKSQVETFPTNDTVLGEMERASLDNSNGQSVYIIVGLLIAFVAFLLIYYLNKRKNQKKKNLRKRNKANENGYGEEMKPLGKSAEVEKIVEPIRVPLAESAPLLNGQNGKINEENNVKALPIEDTKDMEEVELRKPSEKDGLLTPQLERVTIKAGEIPDSVPKTPLLVHRSVNSDGEIITTAMN